MIVLSHPDWWLDHVDELVDGLRVAAQSPERDEPAQARDDEVVIADPGWWAERVDELTEALARAADREPPDLDLDIDVLREQRARDEQVYEAPDLDLDIDVLREQRARDEQDHEAQDLDLDALREQRMRDPEPYYRPPEQDHDHGLER